MKDIYWTLLRQVLLVVSAPLALRWGVSAADGAGLVDAVLTAAMAATTAGTMAWGLYVRKGTVTVSEATGARATVKTISAATGATEK